MTASTMAPAERGARSRPGTAEPWAGTLALLRLYLRLDRVRIPVWTAAVGLLVAGSVASMEEIYSTPESLQARAALMANPSAVMMTGPAFGLDNYTFGAMVANELSLYLLLAAAIMSILLVVRHTRADEEAGRLEILRALPVGRFAPATAAALTVTLANLLVGAALVVALVGTGMEAASSLAMGVGTALTGLVFGAVAVVTAQLTEHSRAATGMALATLGTAFLVRAVGDVIDNQGSWLSWFSPLAWAQQTRMYVDLRWWPLALSAMTVVVLLAVAVALSQRRDLGAGLRKGRPGPAEATRTLLSPVGLARRLLRGAFLGWALGTFAFALACGSMATSLEDAVVEIPELGEWIAVDLDDLTSSFAASMLSFVAVALLAFAVSAVLRLRTEEEAGRVEAVLVTGSSRLGFLGGWLGCVAVQTLLMAVLTGLGLGLGMWAVTGDVAWVGRLATGALAYLPATYLVAAVAVALYGSAPRWATVTWLPVIWVAFTLFLGTLLDLPSWAMDLSPFTHTPLVPSADVEAAPLLAMAGLALLLTVVGFVTYRRRDIVPG
ncbi:ABC transporter permease [Thermasporomyces composti]|uniref:ABC-2 type transport system permease protein n=1 Tax=Thermasporomyces composti TaxID=696763 RepID=A0A3D9VK25_THECX|nr:polyketide antibiotic transporter [Thermasporomyces composti]REF37711.1 ABC-2 type transport system permease protein [Thermasporomyces composti]